MAADYVKPCVERRKNDAMDAETIREAAIRQTMRSVPVKPPVEQSAAMLRVDKTGNQ